jgi:hypothetical protein
MAPFYRQALYTNLWKYIKKCVIIRPHQLGVGDQYPRANLAGIGVCKIYPTPGGIVPPYIENGTIVFARCIENPATFWSLDQKVFFMRKTEDIKRQLEEAETVNAFFENFMESDFNPKEKDPEAFAKMESILKKRKQLLKEIRKIIDLD